MKKSDKQQDTHPDGPKAELSQSSVSSVDQVTQSIADRIRVLMGSQRNAEFARKCDIGDSLLRQYLDGAIPGADKAAKIAIANGVSVDWLITGAISDGIGGRTIIAHSNVLREQLNARYDTTQAFALIPIYDVRAAAGHGALVDDRPPSEHWAFSRVWLEKNVGVAPSRLQLVTVAGDSMEPDLHDGDVVMIDVGDKDVLREGIYIFALGDHIYVKRLSLQGDKLVIISRNSDLFPAREISTMRENLSFRLIGRVVGQPTFRRF